MTGDVKRIALAVLLVVGLAAAAAGVPAIGADAGTAAAPENETRPGERLAGTAGVRGVRLQGSVDLAAYEDRLARAGTPGERAAVVDATLNETDRQLAALSREADRLDRARANGSMSPGEYRARMATIAAAVEEIAAILARTERAIDSLPADRRDAVRDRVADQRTRVESLADRIDDVEFDAGDPGRAAPLTAADLEAAVGAGGEGAPGSLQALFGSERITLHVRKANGTVARYHVQTRDGRVVEAGTGPAADPTLHVYTTHEVVREVRDSADPWGTVERAVAEDRIRYRGAGLVGRTKYGLLSLAQDTYDFARGILDWV